MSYTAIFGGTFNPFHIGHYEILKALCEQDFIDKVLVMPDRVPPHKEFLKQVTDLDRTEMCRIVCSDFKKAELCLIEFEREGKSYTFDTVSLLKQKNPDTRFAVVCGGDMIKSLDTWYRFNDLKNAVSFIAFNRDGDKDFCNDIKRLENLGAEITVIDKAITAVSSTHLRSKIDKSLLPDGVYDYIIKKGLYNGKEN